MIQYIVYNGVPLKFLLLLYNPTYHSVQDGKRY